MQFCTKVVHGKSWRHRTRLVLHGGCKMTFSSTGSWCGNPCPICKNIYSCIIWSHHFEACPMVFSHSYILGTSRLCALIYDWFTHHCPCAGGLPGLSLGRSMPHWQRCLPTRHIKGCFEFANTTDPTYVLTSHVLFLALSTIFFKHSVKYLNYYFRLASTMYTFSPFFTVITQPNSK